MHQPDSRPTLGVVAISQNEEKDLPGFLDHLLPWVNEIVIVDDESSDRTVEIAEARGSKVRVVRSPAQAHEGFCDQRNKGIHNSSSEWLLHMDIDERVTPDLAEEILKAIGDESKDAYRYRRLNFFLHRPVKGGGWRNWNNIQLARRHLRFSHRLHEVIVAPESNRVGQLQGYMWHLGDNDYQERLRKSLLYCSIEADKILECGDRVSAAAILFAPIWQFFKSFVLQAGFRDGVPGLIISIHSADSLFRAKALAWDKQNHRCREVIEKNVRQKWNATASVDLDCSVPDDSHKLASSSTTG